MAKKEKINTNQYRELLLTLKLRFKKNTNRHKGISWTDVQKRLDANPDKLAVLNKMEATGGEPDVVDFNKKTGAYIFYDCVAESPKERRSCCYDDEALASRKEHKPKYSATGLAKEIGIELLTEEQYRALQQLGSFDLKTSSWVQTPDAIRQLGGALFCDRRYNTVFLYHNGAESYYGSRGFRGCLSV